VLTITSTKDIGCPDPYILVSTLSADATIVTYSRENFTDRESAYDELVGPGPELKGVALQKVPSARSSSEVVVSSVFSKGLLVLTVLEKDLLGSPDFYGQVTINISDYYPQLYRGVTVSIPNAPLGEYAHKIYSACRKAINPKDVYSGSHKGTLALSLRMPPLHVNLCGWMMKMSTGLFSKGVWKKKWIVLCGDKLWLYETPFTLEHVKGCILCANILSFVEHADGQSFSIKFIEQEGHYGDKKISRKSEKSWDLRWDPSSSMIIRQTWKRRLAAASPVLFKGFLQSVR
jgi:hypothetical protein